MTLRNPTTGPRIVPFGVERSSADVLPSGRPAFRVTQRFGDTDRFFGGLHGAIDIGNYSCGDPMLAAVAGRVRNVKDSYGALIVEIIETSGAKVGYGHLSRFAVADGASVVPGQIIGYVGDTGLGGVCHCHFYRKDASGKLFDPWPLLAQNTQSAAAARVRINGDGINVRRGPGPVGGALDAVYGATASGWVVAGGLRIANCVAPSAGSAAFGGFVRGARHGIGTYPDQWAKVWVGGAYRAVARPLVAILPG